MTFERFFELVKEADVEMKERRGHSFQTILKTRCKYCGLSQAQARGKCRGWFQTFLNILGNKVAQKEEP